MTNRIITADAKDGLKQIESKSIDCCVTSPPYYGLRDYGIEGQIGLEESPDIYIEKLVEVFREVRRVLADDGTLWVVIGDSFAGGKGGRGDFDRMYTRPDGSSDRFTQKHNGVRIVREKGECKPKDLFGIPWMLAFALRNDGWFLRSDIIWHKPNAMPESVKDRPTRAHEYVFLFSKSKNYYYDHAAITERATSTSIKKFTDNGKDKQHGHGRRHSGFNGRYAAKLEVGGIPITKNRRSVWNVATKPYPEAHFATFPPELVRPCILAGCKPDGTVLDPFFGAGTTGLVALEEGRSFIGIEINPVYVEIAEKRLGIARGGADEKNHIFH